MSPAVIHRNCFRPFNMITGITGKYYIGRLVRFEKMRMAGGGCEMFIVVSHIRIPHVVMTDRRASTRNRFLTMLLLSPSLDYNIIIII